MTPSAFSALWYRVAPLQAAVEPRALRIERQVERAKHVWRIVSHADAGRALRLNAAAYAFAGRLDGNAHGRQIWDSCSA